MHKIKKSLKPQNWFILLILGLSSAFLLYGCVPTPTPPEKAPDFTLPDMEGNLFTLSEKEGQPVVLCFFKTDVVLRLVLEKYLTSTLFIKNIKILTDF